jgi:hypothetical protein
MYAFGKCGTHTRLREPKQERGLARSYVSKRLKTQAFVAANPFPSDISTVMDHVHKNGLLSQVKLLPHLMTTSILVRIAVTFTPHMSNRTKPHCSIGDGNG